MSVRTGTHLWRNALHVLPAGMYCEMGYEALVRLAGRLLDADVYKSELVHK